MLFGNERKKRQAQKTYRESAKHVKKDDVGKAASGGASKIDQLGSAPGPLMQLWDDIKTMTAMLRDYTDGSYRDVPWTTVASITAAVLYFVSPIDLIPDVIPGVGYVDDAAVIAMCVKSFRCDIETYRKKRRKA